MAQTAVNQDANITFAGNNNGNADMQANNGNVMLRVGPLYLPIALENATIGNGADWISAFNNMDINKNISGIYGNNPGTIDIHHNIGTITIAAQNVTLVEISNNSINNGLLNIEMAPKSSLNFINEENKLGLENNASHTIIIGVMKGLEKLNVKNVVFFFERLYTREHGQFGILEQKEAWDGDVSIKLAFHFIKNPKISLLFNTRDVIIPPKHFAELNGVCKDLNKAQAGNIKLPTDMWYQIFSYLDLNDITPHHYTKPHSSAIVEEVNINENNELKLTGGDYNGIDDNI